MKGQAESLLVRAVGASADDLGQVVAAKLHNNMLRMDPSFDFRALGHRNFTQYLASSPRVKLLRPRGRTDVLVELVSDQYQKGGGPGEPSVSFDSWDSAVDAAWSEIRGDPISGSKAAAEAAKALGVSKISVSPYRNLQGLLDASELLQARWSRDGNAISPRRVSA